jgi:hypothetical protein
VALVEADITTNYSREASLYLHSSVCEESIVYGLEKLLLRRLTSTSMGNWVTIFDSRMNPFFTLIYSYKSLTIFQGLECTF